MIKILFVCNMNRFRSRTAEDLYKKDERLEVKSAGIFPDAKQPVTKELLDWADYVIAMEDLQRNFMESAFPDEAANKPIYSLQIPDMFEYMEPELVKMLEDRVENILKDVS